MTDNPIIVTPVGGEKDRNDDSVHRHGRAIHEGFPVGRYLQAPPFFFTRDGHPVPMLDMYRGGSIFLIAGGPSVTTFDLAKIREPGVMTWGINNSVKTFRPKMWSCVDNPANFIRSIWLDPTIQKFVPFDHVQKKLFDSDAWAEMDMTVGDCPNVFYYKRNEQFRPEQFLWEDTINWGNHAKYGGGRSVMLATLRLMFLLGFRKVFLLGVDFNMDKNTRYHFDQDRSDSSIRGNQETYEKLKERFTLLRPLFEKEGFHVYNCNPNSRLKVFDHMPFDEAAKIARAILPSDLAKERTAGLYDRAANEKKAMQQQQQVKQQPVATGDLRLVIQQLNAARSALHSAKARTEAMRAISPESPEFDANALAKLIDEEDRCRKHFRTLVSLRDQLQGKAPA